MWVASWSKGGAGLSGAGKEGRCRHVPAGWGTAKVVTVAGTGVRAARCLEALRLYQLMDLQGSPFSATKRAAGQEDTGCFREEGASKCCAQSED